MLGGLEFEPDGRERLDYVVVEVAQELVHLRAATRIGEWG